MIPQKIRQLRISPRALGGFFPTRWRLIPGDVYLDGKLPTVPDPCHRRANSAFYVFFLSFHVSLFNVLKGIHLAAWTWSCAFLPLEETCVSAVIGGLAN